MHYMHLVEYAAPARESTPRCGSRRSRTVHEFSVFFVPRRTIVCEKVFQEEGVYGDVVLGEYALDFIPFESDVLSLELDTAFRVRALLPGSCVHVVDQAVRIRLDGEVATCKQAMHHACINPGPP